MKKTLWGLFFITMSALLIVGQIMEIPNTMTIALTVFVGAVLIESILGKNQFFSLLAIAIIIIINKENLNIENIENISILASAVLLSIGISILTGKKSKKCKYDEAEVSYEDSDIIDCSVSFGSSIKYITSEDFKKAVISCSFAGLQIYFDNATIKGDTAEIELDVSYSGVELYIPKTWKIINNVNISFAGIDERNKSSNHEKTVILKGKVNLAGVEIIYI